MNPMKRNRIETRYGQRSKPGSGRVARPMLLILCALFLLSACSLPGKSPKPPRQFYLLQAGGGSNVAGVGSASPCLSLRISTPAAAPGFDTARIAYVNDPPRLDYFAYHLWVDPPARMLAAAMETRLDASGLFGAVLSQSSGIDTDLRLDTDLLRLQQVFSGSGSSVELVMKVVLVDLDSRELLGSRTFQYNETTNGANPTEGVDAAQQAVNRFLDDLVEFVAQAIAEKSPLCD